MYAYTIYTSYDVKLSRVSIYNILAIMIMDRTYSELYCDTNIYGYTKYTAYNAVIFLYIHDLN